MVRNTNLDPGFKELLDSFPDKLLEMTGIGADHLDFMSYMDMLMKPSYATIADVSYDPNANVAQTTVASSMQESSKPLMKIYCLTRTVQARPGQVGQDGSRQDAHQGLRGRTLPLRSAHALHALLFQSFRKLAHVQGAALHRPHPVLPCPPCGQFRAARHPVDHVCVKPPVGSRSPHRVLHGVRLVRQEGRSVEEGNGAGFPELHLHHQPAGPVQRPDPLS